jgi:hypothetical protein
MTEESLVAIAPAAPAAPAALAALETVEGSSQRTTAAAFSTTSAR